MRKIRYISSPRQDDMLSPGEYRRYLNHIFGYFLFSFAFISFLISSFIMKGDYSLLSFLTGKLDYTKIQVSILYGKLFFTFTPSLLLAYLITQATTKPMNRVVHLKGNFLDDSSEVINNLRKDFHVGNFDKDIALIREGEIDYNRTPFFKLKKTVYFPPTFLELSTVIRGEAGSGKSIVMNRLIKESIDNGHKMILHSIKGDEIKMLSKYCSFYLIEPWNKRRGYAIDFFGLVVNDDEEKENASIRTFVDSFNKPTNGKADFFDKGASSVLEAFTRCEIKSNKPNGKYGNIGGVVKTWNSFNVNPVDTDINLNDPDQVKDELEKNQEQLTLIKQFLQKWNTSATIYIDPQNPKTSLCVLASCIEVIRKFEVLANFWKGRQTLDIRKWVNTAPKKDRPVIILTNSNQFSDVADCYISAFINLIVSEVIEESYQVNWKLYFMLDEFPQLSSINLKEFLKLPDVGRGKGIRTILALQRTSQIKSSFNMDGDSFIGAFQNKIWCRMATDDLTNIEKELGKRDIRETIISSNHNAQGKSLSIKVTDKPENVINSNDLQNELGVVRNKQGKFLGVKVLIKITNNPRVALVTLPPVVFPERVKVGTRVSTSANKSKSTGTNDEDTIEEKAITHDHQVDHQVEVIPIESEQLDTVEADPMESASTHGLAHAIGGETLSAVVTVADLVESLESHTMNNNQLQVVEDSKESTSIEKTEKKKIKIKKIDKEIDL